MLIGWRAANMSSMLSGHLPKNDMWASEVCFACLTWLYGLFVRTLISRTSAYAFCLGTLIAVPIASITVCVQIYMSNCLA